MLASLVAFLTRCKVWLARIWHWLLEVRIAWIGILVPVIGYWIAFHAFRSELAILAFGVTLEILGLLIALFGLIETRKYFDLPTLRSALLSWLDRVPRWTQHRAVGLVGVAVGTSTGKMRASAWSESRPEDSVEAKIEALLKNVGRLRDELHSTQRELDELERKHEDLLKGESQARAAAEKQLKDTMRRALTDGFQLSIVGLLWIILGLFASSFSAQLA